MTFAGNILFLFGRYARNHRKMDYKSFATPLGIVCVCNYPHNLTPK